MAKKFQLGPVKSNVSGGSLGLESPRPNHIISLLSHTDLSFAHSSGVLYLIQGIHSAVVSCNKCRTTTKDATRDWHRKSEHQAVETQVEYPDVIQHQPKGFFYCVRCRDKKKDTGGMHRHATTCYAITQPEMLEDPDQPVPVARPLAREDLRNRTPEFDPADREPSPPAVDDPIPTEQEQEDMEAVRVDLADYLTTPGPHTVATYPGVNLPGCGIVIDKEYRLFMSCSTKFRTLQNTSGDAAPQALGKLGICEGGPPSRGDVLFPGARVVVGALKCASVAAGSERQQKVVPAGVIQHPQAAEGETGWAQSETRLAVITVEEQRHTQLRVTKVRRRAPPPLILNIHVRCDMFTGKPSSRCAVCAEIVFDALEATDSGIRRCDGAFAGVAGECQAQGGISVGHDASIVQPPVKFVPDEFLTEP
ncbi:hypothetical protein DFH09DRAFT_1275469 [Mycena vulgaris]|nr:hypothetical protein DFH09DRAFT_1275469 [Mycena vulgaris]